MYENVTSIQMSNDYMYNKHFYHYTPEFISKNYEVLGLQKWAKPLTLKAHANRPGNLQIPKMVLQILAN